MPSTSRPSIFDMTGRAKWDAWTSVGKKYTQPKDAQERYLQIAKSLGWSETTVVLSEPSIEQADDDGSPSSKAGPVSGMGGAVSTMASAREEPDQSLHGLAVSDDVAGLTRLLEMQPETDINGRDEFVCIPPSCTFSLSAQRPQGYTPLHLACDRGSSGVVRILLSRGADSRIKVTSLHERGKRFYDM